MIEGTESGINSRDQIGGPGIPNTPTEEKNGQGEENRDRKIRTENPHHPGKNLPFPALLMGKLWSGKKKHIYIVK